jgi:hypothetical protein
MGAPTRRRLSVSQVLGIVIFGILVTGQFVMPDYLASVGAPHSILDSLFATVGLFKLSLETADNSGGIPASVQVLRSLAPLATASSVALVLQRKLHHGLDLFATKKWKGHHVVIGDEKRALLSAKANINGPRLERQTRTVLITPHDTTDTDGDLRHAGIRVCHFPKHSRQLKSVVQYAETVSVDLGDDNASLEWAQHINYLFRDSPLDAPRSIFVYVRNAELVRLESLIPDRRLKIVSIDAHLASAALQIERPTRGLKGPLNVIIVSDNPQITQLLNAMWRHVRQGEEARVTIVGPDDMKVVAGTSHLREKVHFLTIENLGDTEGVASQLSAYLNAYDQDRFGFLSSPLYIWTKQSGIDALLAAQLLKTLDMKTLDTRIAIVGHAETSRLFSLSGATANGSEGRISVVTDEFLVDYGMVGVVPDQEYLAIGLYKVHQACSRGAAKVTGVIPWAEVSPNDWETSDKREYFSLAGKCLKALHAAGISIRAGEGSTRQLSSPALSRIADHLAQQLGINMDAKTADAEVLQSRYKLIELASRLPSLLGVNIHLVENDSELSIDSETIEKLAKEIHRRYNEAETERVGSGQIASSVNAFTDWQNLLPRMRESNREQARSIQLKLALLRLTLSNDETTPGAWESSSAKPEIIEVLAEIEHQRWCIEMFERSYTHGPDRNDEKKTHPDLLPFEELDEVAKEKDRQSARLISSHLQHVGLTARPFPS